MNAFVPPEYLSFDDAIDRVTEIAMLARDPGSVLTQDEKSALQGTRTMMAWLIRQGRPGVTPASDPKPPWQEIIKEEFSTIKDKEAAMKEQRLQAKDELQRLLYTEQIPLVAITESGSCHPAPGYIWGGRQWFEALRSNWITFPNGYGSSVSGRPIIARDALEEAFNPDGTVKEAPKKEPGSVVPQSVDQELGKHSNRGRPPEWPREVWLECLLDLSLRSEISLLTDSQESIAEALATEVEGITGKKPSIDTIKKDWLRPILKKAKKGDNFSN